MTQKLVAKRLGTKLVTLKSWEQDMAEPRANRLSMLAGLLGVSVARVLMVKVMELNIQIKLRFPEINDILFEIERFRLGYYHPQISWRSLKTIKVQIKERMSDGRENKIKNLKMRSMRRGIKEMTLYLTSSEVCLERCLSCRIYTLTFV